VTTTLSAKRRLVPIPKHRLEPRHSVLLALTFAFLSAALCGCSRGAQTAEATPVIDSPAPVGLDNGLYRGFDRNDYPGAETMAALRKTFAFTGYWLNNPPGEQANSWAGKRAILRQQGWGFLVLYNGRLDAQILKAQKQGTKPAGLASRDAADTVAAAQREGFPPQTILFLDQEEGGSLLEEQAAYLLGWTEAISTAGYRAGVYASGQPVPAGAGKTITTIDDIRSRVKSGHLHEIAIFDAQDACPPAPGCTLHPKPLASSDEMDLSAGGPLVAWQFAQSPQRPELTKACSITYAKDGNCFAPGFPTVTLDMDAATSADPSHGR
jgi:hypothetical protein